MFLRARWSHCLVVAFALMANVARADEGSAVRVKFATSGLPSNVCVNVSGSYTRQNGHCATFQISFYSPGPSNSIDDVKAGRSFCFTFPAHLTRNGVRYDFVSASPASCFNPSQNNSPITVTGTYRRSDSCVAPTITCPGNISVNTDPGRCSAVVECGATASGTPTPTITYSPLGPGDTFPKGTTTVTATATNSCGSSSCTFTVTVRDRQNPTINNCPSNISVNTAPGAQTARATWTTPTVSDNCSGACITRIAGPASGSYFPIGTTTITYRATDSSGNTSTCTFTVTVHGTPPNSPPMITCPGNFTVNTDPGLCTAVVNCGATATGTPTPTITYSPLGPGSAFPKGTTTVTATATNSAGSASCTFTVTVRDRQYPTIVGCPANIHVNAPAGSQTAVATWTVPTVTDNCPGATISRIAGPGPGSSFPIGTTTVTYRATDSSNNTSTCSFTVTVHNPPCTMPTITCPANIHADTDPNQCFANVNFIATATGSPTPTISYSPQGPNTAFPRGTTTVTATATNSCGSVSCTFDVVIGDNQDPMIADCPSNITVATAPGATSAVATWTPPTVSDNCPGVTLIRTAGAAPGSSFPVGTTWIIYTATDVMGRSTTCRFSITVTATPACTAPTLVCPADIRADTDLGVCTAVVNFVATATGNPAPTVTYSVPPNTAFPKGTTLVTAMATNACGSAQCSFSVTVQDNQSPRLMGCPSDIFVDTAPGATSAIATWTEPTLSENCPGGTLIRNTGPAPGSAFPIGTTVVTYTATDGTGNSSVCTFNVTVTGTPPCTMPTIKCPGDLYADTDLGLCSAIVDFVAVGGGDPAPTITYSQNPGTAFPTGVTTVTATATNPCGSVSCTFSITVNDNQSPGISGCPTNIEVTAAEGAMTAVATWTEPTVTDNCDAGIIRVAGGPSGSEFPIGTTTVSYLATDHTGNTGLCSFIVHVIPFGGEGGGDGNTNGGTDGNTNGGTDGNTNGGTDGNTNGNGGSQPPAGQEQPGSTCKENPELAAALSVAFLAPVCGMGCPIALGLTVAGICTVKARRRRVRSGSKR